MTPLVIKISCESNVLYLVGPCQISFLQPPLLSVWVSAVSPLLCHESDSKEVKGVGGVLSEGEGEEWGVGLAAKHTDMERN